MTTIRAILFDLDGTLLDTEALSDKAVLLALGSSLPPHVLEKSPMKEFRLPWDLKKKILGLRGSEWTPLVLQYAKEHWGVTDESCPPSPDELWKAWEENLNSMCEEIRECPGAPKLVDALASCGLPLAIATSSRYSAVDKKRLRHAGMFDRMAAIVAGDDPAVKNGKPAPDIYLEAAKRLNVDPKECLVFEDALSGVRSGKAAGCRVVAIPDCRFSAEEKIQFEKEADVVLEDLWSFDGAAFGIAVAMQKLSLLK